MCTHPWTYKVKQYQELENKCETLKHAWHLCLQAVPVLTTSHTTICCWNKQTNKQYKQKMFFLVLAQLKGVLSRGGPLTQEENISWYFLSWTELGEKKYTWGWQQHKKLQGQTSRPVSAEPSYRSVLQRTLQSLSAPCEPYGAFSGVFGLQGGDEYKPVLLE